MKKLSPGRIVMVFVFLSGLWIAFSDILLLRIVPDPQLITEFSIAKGFLYIAVTAVFLYTLISRYAVQRDSSEMNLRENRAMIANILDTIPQSVFWKDHDSVYIGCNSVFARAAGLENPEQIIGKTDFDLPWPREEAEAYRADDREVMENNRPKFHIIEPLEQADNTRLWIDTTKLPLTDETSRVYGMLGVYEDITDRKRAEEQLRESKEHYLSLFQNMLNGFAYCRMIFDHERPQDFIYLEVNAAFESLTGLKNVVGKKVSEVIPGIRESDAELFEIYGRVALTGRPETFERYVEALKMWFSLSVYSPKKEYFVAVFDVITNRKRAEEELRASERRFREVLENISLIGVMLDTEGRIILCSDYLLSITGWKREEVLNGNWFDLFLPPEIRTEIKNDIFLKSVRTGEIPIHYENPIITRRGERRLIAWSNTIFRNKAGAITGVASIGEDITQQRRTAEALKRSENLLQTIIDTEPDCVKMVDAQGNLITMNRAGLNMIEVDSLDQIKGHNMCPLVASDYRQAFKDLIARIFEGQSGTLMFEMVGLKGRHLWLETRAVPFRNEKDEVVALLGITRDITDRKKLEEQLRQSQKMESIGTLAGGVAHDFNNILAAIVGYGNILQMKMRTDDPLREYLSPILTSAERAASLTQSLLAFSRKQVISPKNIDLNEIIHKIEKFLTRTIGEDIVLSASLSGEALMIFVDPTQIEQVLMNLATNARDAMPKGGRLLIETGRVMLEDEYVRSHGFGLPGYYAVLTVSDTGEGMNEKTQQKIFDPFFTTKELGRGTGLGLAIVYGIVKQNNGYINVYSEAGKGTAFKIYLPLVSSRAGEKKNPDVQQPLRGGTETILLAEDDESVRLLNRGVLQEFGYTVIEAADGEEALQKFREHRDRINLFILDVVMPKKNGRQVFEEAKRSNPNVKVIFTSGYPADLIQKEGVLEKGLHFLSKPSSPQALLRMAREVLDQ